MSDREGDQQGDHAHGPSASGGPVGGPGAHHTHPDGGPPPRSPARFVGYILIFVILVAVSLYLRAAHNKSGTAAQGGSPSTPATAASGLAIVDTEWAGQACRTTTPSGGYMLRAAYDSTQGTVNSWIAGLSSGAVTQTMTGGSPNLETAVCYIDGPWQLPPSAQGAVPTDTLLRAIVLVPKGGTAVSGPIGPAASLTLARPQPAATIPPAPPAVTPTSK
ncbi:MAG TPA: hypothetical protein VFW71_07100 [Actinomycetota bacterium]|nr:hypothetical protein [Actinomycetota bacterium]